MQLTEEQNYWYSKGYDRAFAKGQARGLREGQGSITIRALMFEDNLEQSLKNLHKGLEPISHYKMLPKHIQKRLAKWLPKLEELIEEARDTKVLRNEKVKT